jgi:glutathione synthase/RimK-type ligase-like ATP-grasp enzyme
MILIVSTELDLHADVVQKELEQRGAECLRFDTEKFPTKVGLEMSFNSSGWGGVLHCASGDVYIPRIRAVYYRRPATSLVDPAVSNPDVRKVAEAQCEEALQGLWRALDCYWMSHPLAIRRASNKIFQLSIVRHLGFQIPDTLITTNPAQAERFFHEHHGQVVVKPLAGVSFIAPQPMGVYTSRVKDSDLAEIEAVRFAPTLFQAYVPKDVELRITVVRNQVFTAEIHSQLDERTKDDWRRIPPKHIPHRVHKLPREIQSRCVALVSQLGLEFGALDMIKTPDGRYIFLEINPNGQWLWIEEFTGLPIAAAIAQALMEANELHE